MDTPETPTRTTPRHEKKLPISLQNLREMRTQGYAYADKTAHVAHLIEEGKDYFLDRPRRFGKSLLVDTLAEAFAGSRELFGFVVWAVPTLLD